MNININQSNDNRLILTHCQQISQFNFGLLFLEHLLPKHVIKTLDRMGMREVGINIKDKF